MKEGINALDNKGKARICPKCHSKLVILQNSSNYRVVCSICSYEEPCHLRHLKISEQTCSKCPYSPKFTKKELSKIIESHIKKLRKRKSNKIALTEKDVENLLKNRKCKYPKLLGKCPQAWNSASTKRPISLSFSK